MFSWLSEHFRNFSSWLKGTKRRGSYRKKRAPIVTVPLNHESVKKVHGYKFKKKKRGIDPYYLRIILIILLAVILIISAVTGIVLAKKIKNAGGLRFTWLDEITGKTDQVSSALVSEDEESVPDIVKEEQSDDLLVYTNADRPLPEDYKPDIIEVEGVKVNALAEENLKELLSKAREEGIEITLESGFVSNEEQSVIYEEKLSGFYGEGYTKARAEDAAKPYMSGCSEFQTGLSVKVSCSDYTWLSSNMSAFGFVQRYPEEKKSVTGVSPDKTVIRYVGKDNAAQMTMLEKCVEEYAEYISER